MCVKPSGKAFRPPHPPTPIQTGNEALIYKGASRPYLVGQSEIDLPLEPWLLALDADDILPNKCYKDICSDLTH